TLALGWTLLPGEGLRARGHGMRLDQADARFDLRGVYANASLALHSKEARLGQGQGRLILTDGVTGEVRFHWADGLISIQPFTVETTFGPTLALVKPAILPLTLSGEFAPTWAL